MTYKFLTASLRHVLVNNRIKSYEDTVKVR